jgi:hypothetical protein
MCRYCQSQVVQQDLQEIIYNVVPGYQNVLYDPHAGPDGTPKAVCRDREGILDELPACAPAPLRSASCAREGADCDDCMPACSASDIQVVQQLYNASLLVTEGVQCYGRLSQYLDATAIPWMDRLERTADSLPLWQPAAHAWQALHTHCRSIISEVRLWPRRAGRLATPLATTHMNAGRVQGGGDARAAEGRGGCHVGVPDDDRGDIRMGGPLQEHVCAPSSTAGPTVRTAARTRTGCASMHCGCCGAYVRCVHELMRMRAGQQGAPANPPGSKSWEELQGDRDERFWGSPGTGPTLSAAASSTWRAHAALAAAAALVLAV